jgi:hypothetical protein
MQVIVRDWEQATGYSSFKNMTTGECRFKN